MEGNEEIVVKCEKYDLSVYRRMTDLSPPPFFNFDCPQSIERRVLDRGNVDMQMNSELFGFGNSLTKITRTDKEFRRVRSGANNSLLILTGGDTRPRPPRGWSVRKNRI